MILTGPAISTAVESGEICVEPFSATAINPNSIDLHLDDRLLLYDDSVIDPAAEPKVTSITIPSSGYVLGKGQFALASSSEVVGSEKYVPLLHGKSGIARIGLFIHVTADLIDIGSIGNITLQLFATLPIRLYPGMPIAQMSFWTTKGEITLYRGKYQGSDGPQATKIYQDAFWLKMAIERDKPR